ncbi:galactokinase [Psychroserpens algicola]|uniref:Galactokinase n=1 Tax=Psychroserpens algicola TaxID=1719034 RepID=A0ABT0H618_9FLAO|nr:galactokinase [Psychroserpens algicola]MCK8479818.1 galactokinase [Psychroserpens algicola]
MNNDLVSLVKNRFRKSFGNEDILVFSPGRINLIGEHTDYNNGYVFPAAIDKGIIMALGKSNTNRSTIISVDMNDRLELFLKDLKRIEANTWKNYIIGVIAEIQKKRGTLLNFNCVFAGDIPVGSGLSSSAALENALVFGCNTLFNLKFDKMELIHISQKAEHNFVGVNCGIMDQFASMFGEADKALFLDCKTLQSESVAVNMDEFEIILINSNVKHALAESAYNDRYAVCQKLIKLLNKTSLREVSYEELDTIKTKISEPDYRKGLYVLQENDRVLQCREALEDNNMKKVGAFLFQSHKGQSEMYEISCDELDFLVNEAKLNDAVIGARMMGGGFGGCTINLVTKNGSEYFQKKIAVSYKKQFKKDCSIYKVKLSDGTRLI